MSFDERPQDGYPQYSGRPGPSQYQEQAQQGYPEPTRYPLQPGYYPDQQPAYGIARDNSTATLALVLGVIGLASGLLITSPFAWWQGNKALAEIDAAPGVYRNRGMAQAGQITGIIGTILLGLGILLLAAVLGIFLVTLNAAS